MNLNWFLSRTVRHASHMRKHVWKILSAQRDLLAPQAIAAVTTAMNDVRRVCEGKLDRKAVEAQMTSLETVANKWLKPYPNAALREENAGSRIIAVCNELMPITRSALIDGTIDMVMATPAAILASHAVEAMARASSSERHETKNIVQLQAEIYVSENI